MGVPGPVMVVLLPVVELLEPLWLSPTPIPTAAAAPAPRMIAQVVPDNLVLALFAVGAVSSGVDAGFPLASAALS